MTLLGNATFGGMFSLFLARKVVDISQREGKIPPFLHFPTESFIAPTADLSAFVVFTISPYFVKNHYRPESCYRIHLLKAIMYESVWQRHTTI